MKAIEDAITWLFMLVYFGGHLVGLILWIRSLLKGDSEERQWEWYE